MNITSHKKEWCYKLCKKVDPVQNDLLEACEHHHSKLFCFYIFIKKKKIVGIILVLEMVQTVNFSKKWLKLLLMLIVLTLYHA
jgi:hypothetical protein